MGGGETGEKEKSRECRVNRQEKSESAVKLAVSVFDFQTTKYLQMFYDHKQAGYQY